LLMVLRVVLINEPGKSRLCAGNIFDKKNTLFHYEKLKDYPIKAAMLKTNPLSEKEALTYHDLENQKIVTISPGIRPHAWTTLEHIFLDSGCTMPQFRRVVTSPLVLINSLQDNNEVSLYGGFIYEYKNEFIKTYEMPGSYSSLYAIWKKGHTSSNINILTVITAIKNFLCSV
ncbi:MAG: hypothetical protein LIP11_02550, partial [Clostridiales bacterium]|nr:hypothetical protein [Clostridiales bacterium]